MTDIRVSRGEGEGRELRHSERAADDPLKSPLSSLGNFHGHQRSSAWANEWVLCTPFNHFAVTPVSRVAETPSGEASQTRRRRRLWFPPTHDDAAVAPCTAVTGAQGRSKEGA